MRIHTLTTGSVRVKRSFLFPSPGPRRQLDLFLPGPWSEPLPIHCFAIEHEGRLLLVDCGESAGARDIPFARFEVAPEQELPNAMAEAGLAPEDVSEVLFTHHHGDHVDGSVHVRARLLIADTELRFIATAFPRLMRRVLRQPLPPGFAPEPIALDGEPFGAFAHSRALGEDGRIVAVATPGHTPGHISVICIDDDGRHVMLAGDATDTLEQQHARRADAVGPDPAVHVKTLETILAHCERHPTIYLPSHDPQTAQRLEGAVTVGAGAEPVVQAE
jgi:N-acyl homoserine lactone hydrolase